MPGRATKYNEEASKQLICAALSEEEEMDHGGRPTMTDMCATNRHAAINIDVLADLTRMKKE